MRGRSISVLVTFSSDISRNEIYDYFDTFGKEIWVNEIKNMMIKRYSVDCPEEKVIEYVKKFNLFPGVVLVCVENQRLFSGSKYKK